MEDVWIRTQRAAVASRRASNLATHLRTLRHPFPYNLATHLPTLLMVAKFVSEHNELMKGRTNNWCF
jgi:hypothetical protein